MQYRQLGSSALACEFAAADAAVATVLRDH
jgi:hypothetical protein